MTQELEVKNKETQVAQVPSEDTVFSTGITLPVYADATDAKVLSAVKSVFKGFSPEEADNLADADSVANYITKAVLDINSARQSGDASLATVNGAIAARFWYLADRLDSTLSSGVLGDNAAQKLSAMVEPHMAVSTIYAYRLVASRMTAQDAWLLGVRGCRPSHLRKISQISDDTLRKGIIRTFIETIRETSDPVGVERARASLIAACGTGSRVNMVEAGVSNMEDAKVGAAVDSSDFMAGMKAMRTLKKTFEKLTDNDKAVDMRDSLSMLWVSSEDPEANAKVEEARELAKTTLEQMDKAEANIKELRQELQSIAEGLTPTDES